MYTYTHVLLNDPSEKKLECRIHPDLPGEAITTVKIGDHHSVTFSGKRDELIAFLRELLEKTEAAK